MDCLSGSGEAGVRNLLIRVGFSSNSLQTALVWPHMQIMHRSISSDSTASVNAALLLLGALARRCSGAVTILLDTFDFSTKALHLIPKR